MIEFKNHPLQAQKWVCARAVNERTNFWLIEQNAYAQKNNRYHDWTNSLVFRSTAREGEGGGGGSKIANRVRLLLEGFVRWPRRWLSMAGYRYVVVVVVIINMIKRRKAMMERARAREECGKDGRCHCEKETRRKASTTTFMLSNKRVA